MAPRSPARWLAPLALVAAAVALLVILSSSSTDQPAQDSAPLAPETTGTATSKKHTTTTTKPATTTTPTGPTNGEKTYTVQEGDYLSTVSEKTGVSVDRLRELNPGLDANSMTVGQEIKLQP
jgi:LysM repeat protein